MPDPADSRVLIVCAADFSAPSEQQAFGFAQWLSVQGGRVMVSIRGEAASLEGQRFADADRVEILVRGSPRGRGSDAAARVAAFEPTAIYAFCPRAPVIAAARWYRSLTGAPVFVHFEDDEWGLSAPPRGGSALRRAAWLVTRSVTPALPELHPRPTSGSLAWTAAEAAGLDALTPALAREVTRRHGRPCAVVLPITPRVRESQPGEPAGRAGAGEIVVGFTGALFGPHLPDYRILLRAIAVLQRGGRSVRLLHAGRIAPRFHGARLVAEAGATAGSVVFLGHVPAQEARALLTRVDVLVQPGAPSAFNRLRLPSKLQTYLASGTPVVTFGSGFGELLEHRVDAFLTTTGDPAELAEAIAQVVDAPELNARLRQGGPATAARLFDTERNARRLLAHLCGAEHPAP